MTQILEKQSLKSLNAKRPGEETNFEEEEIEKKVKPNPE